MKRQRGRLFFSQLDHGGLHIGTYDPPRRSIFCCVHSLWFLKRHNVIQSNCVWQVYHLVGDATLKANRTNNNWRQEATNVIMTIVLWTFATTILVVIASSTIVRSEFVAPRHHVLFVVVDDLGFDDVGFRSGGEIRTPHIDALAREGVILNKYYVQDVCSPSRATFMTGRYAMHHSIVDWIPPGSAYGLPLNETTMAEKFSQVGYTTAMSGKWHLGFYKWGHTPTFRGFDSFLGFYGGGEDYFTHENSGAYDFRRDPRPNCGEGCSQINWEDRGVYSTTVFTREAVRVVDAHHATYNSSVNENPLFLYLAFQGVHAPAQVPERYVSPYASTITDSKRRTFAGMLSAVDEGIGNVTAALRAAGMLDSTTIVFTSDNGGPVLGGDAVGARNWPMRGGKHSIWEGGVRATAFVSGAGIAPSQRGTTYDQLMHGADWFPTLADIAGYDLKGTLPLDGVSQWSGISSTSTLTPPRTSVVLGNSTNLCSWDEGDPRRSRYVSAGIISTTAGCGFALRDGDWKIVQGYGGNPDDWCNTTSSGRVCLNTTTTRSRATECPKGWCLYNITNDPLEFHEVSKDFPDALTALQEKMRNVLESYVEYRIDPSCPTAHFANDSHVGKAWAPWCAGS